MDELGVVVGQRGAQLLDDADHRDTVAFGRLAEGVEVELVDPAHRGNRRSGVGRDHAGRSLGGSEGRFDVELRLEPGRRRRRFGNRAVGDEMVERTGVRSPGRPTLHRRLAVGCRSGTP